MTKRLYKLQAKLYEKLVLFMAHIFLELPKGDDKAKEAWAWAANRIFKRVKPVHRDQLSAYDMVRLIARETGLVGDALVYHIKLHFPPEHRIVQACKPPINVNLIGYDPNDPALPDATQESHLGTWLLHQFPTLNPGDALFLANYYAKNARLSYFDDEDDGDANPDWW